MDWSSIERIHFVGIKGVAMASLAVWAKEAGYSISGSDVVDVFPTDYVLQEANIEVSIGFSEDHIQSQDLIIYTGAHGGKDNIEVQKALSMGIATLPHGKALGEVTKFKKVIAVAGCHGKTTTTAMIATILMTAGLDPSYAIGSGNVQGLGFPGHAGNGEYFIVEADEYVTDPHHDKTPRFLWLHPSLLVTTTIDFDHPDVYENMEEIGKQYQLFVRNIKDHGVVIWNKDDRYSQLFISSENVQYQTYGSINADAIIGFDQSHQGTNTFSLSIHNSTYAFDLSVPGKHNVYNAASAVLAALAAGVSIDNCKDGLKKFKGASRRFEYLGEWNGITYIDDYAHHPKEIAATIESAREWYPDKRIIIVFQPHTYSRTQSLLHEFPKSFIEADEVLITGIYGSAREAKGTITGKTLADQITTVNPHVYSFENKHDIFVHLRSALKKDDVVMFMGAGDIGLWGREFVESMKRGENTV